MKYETHAGLPTKGLTYSKLLDHLRESQECCALMGHLCKTETGLKDDALARGWYAVAEGLRKLQHYVTALAQGDLQ